MAGFDMESFIKLIAKDKRSFEMFRYLINNSYIRVVNYHNTNIADKERFDAEIKYFSEHFVPVRLKDLDRFFETGKWPYEKPGLIPAIFEGFRNHYDIILPILDKYHFTGWFYLPSFFMDVPVEEQLPFSEAHDLTVTDPSMYPDKRVALSWDEVRDIASRHEMYIHNPKGDLSTAEVILKLREKLPMKICTVKSLWQNTVWKRISDGRLKYFAGFTVKNTITMKKHISI